MSSSASVKIVLCPGCHHNMLRSADHLWDMFLEGINEGCGLDEDLPLYIDIRRTTKATICFIYIYLFYREKSSSSSEYHF